VQKPKGEAAQNQRADDKRDPKRSLGLPLTGVHVRDKRSHAGPAPSKCKPEAQLALAGAAGWEFERSFLCFRHTNIQSGTVASAVMVVILAKAADQA